MGRSILRVHGVVMGLLEHHILDQRLHHHVLLFHRTRGLVPLLADHHTLRLGLEQDATRGDGSCRAVLGLVDTDAREAHLEDADTVQLHLLAHLEEVLQRLAQLVEHRLDVALLHRCLRLDERGQLLGLDELLVIHRRGIVLAIGVRILVVVLHLNEFLTHRFFEKLKS